MTAPAISQLGTDFWVPNFDVKVGGKPVDRKTIRDILSVSFRDSLKGIDSFELVVNNWDEERRILKYSDGDLFSPGQKVELKLGYRDKELVPVLIGEITSLTPRFPAGGVPAMSVGGLSILHRLRKEPQSAVYEDKTETEIAKEVAGRLGIRIETKERVGSGSKPVPYVVQHSEQDITFLMKRARETGYELTVFETADGEPSLYYAPPQDADEIPFKLTWGGSLLSFNPRLTTAKQVGSVTVRAWNPTAKKMIEAKAERTGADEPFSDAFNERREIISDTPVRNEAQAKQLAEAALTSIQQQYITASGSTVGLPELRTGRKVQIDGLGERFSGEYFITATTHTLGDGGYKTSFESRREAS